MKRKFLEILKFKSAFNSIIIVKYYVYVSGLALKTPLTVQS